MSLKQKEIKFKPRITLNHNICIFKKKHTKQISKQNKKKERKGAKKDLNPASSASRNFSLPLHYTTKDDYVSLVKSL